MVRYCGVHEREFCGTSVSAIFIFMAHNKIVQKFTTYLLVLLCGLIGTLLNVYEYTNKRDEESRELKDNGVRTSRLRDQTADNQLKRGHTGYKNPNGFSNRNDFSDTNPGSFKCYDTLTTYILDYTSQLDEKEWNSIINSTMLGLKFLKLD